MKKIFRLSAIAAFVMSLAACETYKVDEPDYTAIKGVDGQYVCFAYDKADMSEPVAVFHVEVTNTTDNAKDAAIFTITDCSPYVYGSYMLDAVRFKASCSPADGSFSASAVTATEPYTCYNVHYGQGYYTFAGRNGITQQYKVTVNGKVIKDGKSLASGGKADTIEFTYTRTYPDGEVEDYVVKGTRNTGWEEDMIEYSDWMDENY